MRHKDVICGGSGEQLVLSLIDDIYSAALDPSLWKGVVRRIVEAVGGVTGQLHSNSAIVLESLWAPHGFGEEVMGQYAQYYHQHDEWTLAADATGLRACRAVTGEELVQFGNFKNSEFYNDFLKKFDFERIVCCYIDEGKRGDLPKTALCAYRPPGSEPLDAGAIRLLNIVAPHVRRAVQLHWRINDLDHERASKTEVLEHLSVGVALVDDKLQVTYLNQAARSIINADCGLAIVDGELVASFVAEAAELSRSMGAAVRAVVCLDRSFPRESMTVSRTTKGSPYRLTIIPVPVRGAFAIGRRNTAAIVFISETPITLRAGVDVVARTYFLSPAESRLLQELVDGQPLKRAAATLEISVNTAHTQLSSIFRKTGTHRQIELNSLVISIANVSI